MRGGPNAPVREKERGAGKKKRKKKRANWVARTPHAWIREKRALLMLVSERGPCAPARKGKWSGGRREKKNLPFEVRNSCCCWGEKSGRSGEWEKWKT